MPEPVNFRAIKATVDMSHILKHYGLFVEMQTKGERITGLCPFHEEDTPSFQTTSNRRGYYCFGCQAKGNVITFVRHKEQLADDWQAARRIKNGLLSPHKATIQTGRRQRPRTSTTTQVQPPPTVISQPP